MMKFKDVITLINAGGAFVKVMDRDNHTLYDGTNKSLNHDRVRDLMKYFGEFNVYAIEPESKDVTLVYIK